VGLGIGHALVEQQAVQLLQALHPQGRREKALTHQPDLVLHPGSSPGQALALFPAGCRRAGRGFDQIVRAHLQEAPVELPIQTSTSRLADKDRIHRGLHVVVDAARAGPPEEAERMQPNLCRLRTLACLHEHRKAFPASRADRP
jgi:hypothetical protein